jgi:transcriptional regulator with XRE-family HTH domain
MRLGKVLRQWRTSEARTIRETAKEIGINKTTLSHIEHGNECGAETLATILVWLIREGKK